MAYAFTIAPGDFDTSLLPPGARKVGTTSFNKAVNEYLKKEFQGFGGTARIVVGSDVIHVTWAPDPEGPDPIDIALDRLRRGEYPQAIQGLQLLVKAHPDDPNVLYNLGMALSDVGQLDSAERHLRHLVEIDPTHSNARVALGVALARQRRNADAVEVLRSALAIEPDNPHALRNLGGCLLRSGETEEAVKALRRATEVSPDDQQAWFGLAEAEFDRDNLDEADGLFIKTIEIDPFSEIADLAKTRRSEIAQANFRSIGRGAERLDAVMYLLGAIEKFEAMSGADVQRVGFEVATVGMRGLDVNDPEQKYQLQSLPGRFSGLHMVCLMYAAFKIIAPEQDVGFDLSREYQAAMSLHIAKRSKP
jgi:tetratricopeptide (TPR) repeat protein